MSIKSSETSVYSVLAALHLKKKKSRREVAFWSRPWFRPQETFGLLPTTPWMWLLPPPIAEVFSPSDLLPLPPQMWPPWLITPMDVTLPLSCYAPWDLLAPSDFLPPPWMLPPETCSSILSCYPYPPQMYITCTPADLEPTPPFPVQGGNEVSARPLSPFLQLSSSMGSKIIWAHFWQGAEMMCELEEEQWPYDPHAQATSRRCDHRPPIPTSGIRKKLNAENIKKISNHKREKQKNLLQ